jgi:Ca-activated chloride channel family protein
VRSPVLTGVRVRYSGFDAYDVEPRSQPDLFALRPLMVTGKWRGKAEGEIEVSGRTAAGAYSRRFRLADTQPLPSHAALRYLWARTRVSRLADYGPAGVSEQERAEITRLGLAYGLLTPYTSFVAVLEKRRNTQGTARDVEQPLALPLGVSELAVGDFVSAPEPEALPLLLALLALVHFLFRRRIARGPWRV